MDIPTCSKCFKYRLSRETFISITYAKLNNLTSEEEDRFLAAFEVDGELGDIVEVGRLHCTYEVKIGRKVPKSTIYRLLHRHGWRKLAPRGKHPEGDEQAIGQFKKTSHGS